MFKAFISATRECPFAVQVGVRFVYYSDSNRFLLSPRDVHRTISGTMWPNIHIYINQRVSILGNVETRFVLQYKSMYGLFLISIVTGFLSDFCYFGFEIHQYTTLHWTKNTKKYWNFKNAVAQKVLKFNEI